MIATILKTGRWLHFSHTAYIVPHKLARNMSIPPCTLPVNLAPQNAQTYAVKMKALGTSPGVFSTWMAGRLADGAGGVASVTLTTS